MSRYIDADKLEPDTEWDDYKDGYMSYSDLQIRRAKTADVVEVVRCKDCRHYNEYDNGEKIIGEEEMYDGWCMRWSGIENVNRHDYCSYGERAEA